MQTRPSRQMGYRAIGTLCFIVIGFLVCMGELVKISLIRGEQYRLKAERNQLSDTQISAQRGTIYDFNMNVLAKSASAWLVYIDPSKIVSGAQRELIVKNLSELLGVDANTVRKKAERTKSGYEKIAGEVETKVKDRLRSFISENAKEYKLNEIIGIDPDTKRYYPYSSFASTIIGFTDADDRGRTGLELKYDKALTGTAGRIITAQNARQGAMSSDYETTFDPKAGYSLVLTIHEVIQYYLEQSLQQALLDTGAKYAYGVVMDVKTGAILGMTSKPDFDLNHPNRLTNRAAAEKLEAIPEQEDRQRETVNALFAQWRNRTVSDTYEPGSVFKTVLISAALEEGVVDLNTTYTCTGGIQVANHFQRCWKRTGHGRETLTEGFMNSCNPFFITIGQKLGKEKFYKYFEAFGFTEKTGIDLPAEAAPVADVTYHSLKSMGITELSSSSFGQTFQVSPIQMVTAVAAVANGGKLMRPYVVDSLLDGEGNVIEKNLPDMKRQVISQKTADTVAQMMEKVVSKGTGKNAYVAGYRIAGKTGTSEKIGKADAYLASFVGFAPADDPKVAVLIVVDEPTSGHGGGAVAAPIAGDIFEKVLTYLNVDPRYEEHEMESLSSVAPDLVGRTVSEARALAAKYTVNFVGEGRTVISQMPIHGQQIRKGGVIVAYTDKGVGKLTAPVPDLSSHLSVGQANRAAVNAGFNIKLSGKASESGFVSYRQSLPPGSEAEKGTVITVYFKSLEDIAD